MEKYSIVFSDVDGTLLNSEHRVTPLTRGAIQALHERGIPFVIVSARSPSGIYPILKENQFNCPIISYSGGLILDENRQVLLHQGIDRTQAKEIIDYMEQKQFDLSWCVFSIDEWIVKDKRDPRIMREEEIVKAQATQGTIESLAENAKINKILCICNPQEIEAIEKELKNAFPQYSIVKSSGILLEIMENGVTKAAAVKTLCSLWQLDLRAAIAFGDHYNDFEMLETVGCGFLMENAPAELKKRITRTTLDNDHDGIYHALREYNIIP